jgi:hypothetical protein
MYGTTLTDVERVARLQIHDRTAYAQGKRLRRSVRRTGASSKRRLADALGR